MIIRGIKYIATGSGRLTHLSNVDAPTNNSEIFDKLGIKDKYKFQKDVLGYTFRRGKFPNCKTIQDAYKLGEALQKYKKKFNFIS